MSNQFSESGDVVAVFRDMETARAAIRALERAGIEGGDIKLGGRGARQAAVDLDPRQRDAGAVRSWLEAALLFGAIGLVVGGIVGVVTGWLFFGSDRQAIWITTLGMAFVGAPIGALVGAIATTPVSPTWEATYEREGHTGEVRVAVTPSNHAGLDKAAEILESHGSRRIEHPRQLRRA
ncbi:MAG: hypothetical protein HYX51_09640 [Chloroflexi bacterium]|nr:hypothetical protein [Chloroflexota bacterium]